MNEIDTSDMIAFNLTFFTLKFSPHNYIFLAKPLVFDAWKSHLHCINSITFKLFMKLIA